MPYLEVYKAEQEEEQMIEMPNCIGLTIKEAKEVLEGVEVEIQGEATSSESQIIKQTPEAGVKIKQNGKVLLYLN